jgi:hypothetical protein
MELSQEVVVIANDIEEAKPVVEQQQAPTPETVEEAVTDTENKPEKTFTQAELDEIVQKRIAKLERKAERQRIEAETRAKVLAEVAVKPEAPVGKPKVEDYTDYSEYQEALTDWKVDQKLQERDSKRAESEAKARNQSESERVSARQNDMIEAGERKYDDFEEVVKSDKTQYSQAAFLSMIESDIAEDLVYHLAKNPDEAQRIAKLPAYAQAKEIGKLEDKLSAKKPPKTSNAPEPIKPIGSGQTLTKTVEEMTPEEYKEYRLKQKPRWA